MDEVQESNAHSTQINQRIAAQVRPGHTAERRVWPTSSLLLPSETAGRRPYAPTAMRCSLQAKAAEDRRGGGEARARPHALSKVDQLAAVLSRLARLCASANAMNAISLNKLRVPANAQVASCHLFISAIPRQRSGSLEA